MTINAEIFRVDRGSVPTRLAKISPLPMGLRAKSVDHKFLYKAMEGN